MMEEMGPRSPRSVRFKEIPDPGPRKYLLEGLIPMAYPTLLHRNGGTAKTAKLFLTRPIAFTIMIEPASSSRNARRKHGRPWS